MRASQNVPIRMYAENFGLRTLIQLLHGPVIISTKFVRMGDCRPVAKNRLHCSARSGGVFVSCALPTNSAHALHDASKSLREETQCKARSRSKIIWRTAAAADKEQLMRAVAIVPGLNATYLLIVFF